MIKTIIKKWEKNKRKNRMNPENDFGLNERISEIFKICCEKKRITAKCAMEVAKCIEEMYKYTKQVSDDYETDDYLCSKECGLYESMSQTRNNFKLSRKLRDRKMAKIYICLFEKTGQEIFVEKEIEYYINAEMFEEAENAEIKKIKRKYAAFYK